MSVLLATLVMGAALAGAPALSAPAPSPQPSPGPDAKDGPLSIGDKVRWRGDSGRRLVGEIVEREPTTLVIRVLGAWEPIRVPTESIRKLEVSRGERSMANEGTLIGAASAGALGVFLGRTLGCAYAERACRRGDAARKAGISFGFVGAMVGGLVGAVEKTEHWDRVDRRRLQLAVAPARGGLSTRLTVRWR